MFRVISRQMTVFKGEAKAVKLFAKHIKVTDTTTTTMMMMMMRAVFVKLATWTVSLCTQIEEQIKLLQKGVTHIGVGTPGRMSALVEKGKHEPTGPPV